MQRFFFLLFIFLFPGAVSADELVREVTGNLDNDLYAIAISPFEENTVYVGSDKAIFKTEDGGENWQYLYTVKGENQKINFILFDSKDKNTVYLATSNGLFRTIDNGKSFQKIFRKEDIVFYVLQSPEGFLYLGTNNGVYLSKDTGIAWTRLSGIPQETQVFSLDTHPALPRLIYAVTDRGVYRSFDRGENWERVFITQGKEETYIEESGEIEEKEISSLLPRFILINRYNPSIVYLGTTKGFFISSDSGRTWEKKNIANLGEVEIRYIISSPEQLYFATNKGVFKVNLNKLIAEEIYQDIPTHNVRMIALDKDERIWAVTDKGIFKTTQLIQKKMVKENFVENLEAYASYFCNEPTIEEVQKEAIRYAEVYPEKIKNWRTQVRLKAFVPEFDLDYYKTVTTALGATYDRVQVGPRDWSVSLKWNLGNLIWSTDQTSIDVRSRLMVQLRDDILDEVNRLYYERRRVKLSLLLEPPQDLKQRLEKQIRLEELTAGIDALTGGYFSRRLKELEQK
ncbi:MAG: hypothetical protein NC920_02950 [Candidatus Omnitrophica bacterium]|nr:hypothetical protein [Candidatus Omnitrophota bacterium]